MRQIKYFNERVKHLSIFDVKLVQISAMAIALIIVKFVPDILNLNVWWFVALVILASLRPLYVFYVGR